jgi:outer membrane protein assembly factor BamB
VRQPDHHHDGIRLRNGNVLLICLAQLPQHLVSQVKGGRPGTEHNGEMYADYLVEMATDGRVVWDWRTWEHLDPSTDCITAVQDLREAWTHANGLAEMPNGDVVVSFRNISTVIIIDRKTGEIIWKLGAPPLSGQHAPMPLPNGNLLLFDNGPHRLDHTMTFSRVIEVDLATKQIVWKYQERREYEFYSPRISNARRLPNGNTLVCEGDFGRFFEVTTDGELVWEYVNPYFGAGPNGLNNRVFRAYRYSAEEIARAKATGGTQ